MTEAQKRANRKYKKSLFVVRIEFFPKDKILQNRVVEMEKNGVKRATYIKNLIKNDLSIDK